MVSQAVALDHAGGKPAQALHLYKEALPLLLAGLRNPALPPAARDPLQAKCEEYMQRAEVNHEERTICSLQGKEPCE